MLEFSAEPSSCIKVGDKTVSVFDINTGNIDQEACVVRESRNRSWYTNSRDLNCMNACLFDNPPSAPTRR